MSNSVCWKMTIFFSNTFCSKTTLSLVTPYVLERSRAIQDWQQSTERRNLKGY